jgi:hypothetical protein
MNNKKERKVGHVENVLITAIMKLESKQSYELLNVRQKAKVLDDLYLEWKDFIRTTYINVLNTVRHRFEWYFTQKEVE